MKVLVTLPVQYAAFETIDEILSGATPCSGTIGSIIRLADLLAQSGIEVCLSTSYPVKPAKSDRLVCLPHHLVQADRFDCLILHQSHWDGQQLTFGNQHLPKSVLYLHVQTPWTFVHSFFKQGGKSIVCPSQYLADCYRAIPAWRNQTKLIGNTFCPIFQPGTTAPEKRLLFVGAITPTKGFVELMQIWSYLASKQVDLKLAIAGSIGVHKGKTVRLGALGIAEHEFETDFIQPWLSHLPAAYQPEFLGALSPRQLQPEICKSWAVLVNPCWKSLENCSVATLEAQACNRTVFGIAGGGLKETVYQGRFQSLTPEKAPEAVGDRILAGLLNPDAVAENGRLAGEFVRRQFGSQQVCQNWINLLNDRPISPDLDRGWQTTRDIVLDMLRWSRTGILAKRLYSLGRSDV